MKKLFSMLLIAALLVTVLAPAAFAETLKKGSRGAEVKALQEKLNALGYSVGTPDGDFGKKTESAIRDFQKDHGLIVTGEADDATQDAIYAVKKEIPEITFDAPGAITNALKDNDITVSLFAPALAEESDDTELAAYFLCYILLAELPHTEDHNLDADAIRYVGYSARGGNMNFIVDDKLYVLDDSFTVTVKSRDDITAAYEIPVSQVKDVLLSLIQSVKS